MSAKRNSPSPEDIQAYVDGRLAAAQHDRVSAAVAADPELARYVSEFRNIGDVMRSGYDTILDEPVPPAMLRTVLKSRRSPLLRIAAAVSWMAIGGIIGGVAVNKTLSGRQVDVTAEVAFVRPLPREAVYAHKVYVPEVRHAVEVGADERAHLNKWLSKRLANPVAAPDIRDAGYTLVGGRMLADAGRPAAQFMYENEHGTRLTLYVRREKEPLANTAFLHAKSEDLGIIYWVDGSLAYALTGSLDKPKLMSIAKTMYAALNQ
jgi:anti-sigma factor RsiW